MRILHLPYSKIPTILYRRSTTVGGLYLYHSSLACGPSVNIEDHIRDLCARLISASEDEDVAALSRQLRDALREHTQEVRGKLIRASTIPKHTTLSPEKAS